MKLFFAALAAIALLSQTNEAKAYPPSDARSTTITTSSGSGRLFKASFLCETSDGLSWVNTSVPPTGSCPTGNTFRGWVPAGYACCYSTAKANVGAMPTATRNDELSETFDNNRETYWGYITTTSRSPSAGRGNSPEAKLDACMGYAQVDSYPNMGSLADNSQCRTDCDSGTKNGYCNNTQTENGNSNQTNAACKDRCDCWMNSSFGKSYNCEGL